MVQLTDVDLNNHFKLTILYQLCHHFVTELWRCSSLLWRWIVHIIIIIIIIIVQFNVIQYCVLNDWLVIWLLYQVAINIVGIRPARTDGSSKSCASSDAVATRSGWHYRLVKQILLPPSVVVDVIDLWFHENKIFERC